MNRDLCIFFDVDDLMSVLQVTVLSGQEAHQWGHLQPGHPNRILGMPSETTVAWWISFPRKRDIRLVEQLLDVPWLNATQPVRCCQVTGVTGVCPMCSLNCLYSQDVKYLQLVPDIMTYSHVMAAARKAQPKTSHLRHDGKSTVIVIMIQPLVFTPSNDKGILKV